MHAYLSADVHITSNTSAAPDPERQQHEKRSRLLTVPRPSLSTGTEHDQTNAHVLNIANFNQVSSYDPFRALTSATSSVSVCVRLLSCLDC
jgi:hypothetical protein